MAAKNISNIKLVRKGTIQHCNTEVIRWANHSGTAVPGQPVTEVEQTPSTPSSKNQFNIMVLQCRMHDVNMNYTREQMKAQVINYMEILQQKCCHLR